MSASWLPVVLVDMIGSALTLCIAVVCAYYAWQWARHKSDDIFRQYIFLLTLAIVCFAISRSFGHLIKQVLLLSHLPHIWKQISPYSGAINSAMFIVIFAFGIYFHRIQKVHIEIEEYRKDLESLVEKRTIELEEANLQLENVLNSSIPICITNTDFEIVQANSAYEEIWGKTVTKDDKPVKCYDSRPGSLCRTESCPLQQIKEGNTEVTVDSAKFEKNGITSNFIVSGKPFKNTDGNLLGIVESFQNISARIKAENAKADLIDELQEALDRVNLLSGMLPICASCKKIRDDKGYWNQIEGYIRQHADVEFSHGICPECAEKLYPEVFGRVSKKIKDKKNS
jgi:PAS domain-containing protein